MCVYIYFPADFKHTKERNENLATFGQFTRACSWLR